jgi:hypothetical protein
LNRKYADKPPMIIVQGSCVDFEKERPKIMEFIGTLEWGAHTKSKCECSSSGKALGWDFFQIYFDPDFVDKLLDILGKQMKKSKLEYYLKLSDVPREAAQGFRLNPDAYRDDSELEKLR